MNIKHTMVLYSFLFVSILFYSIPPEELFITLALERFHNDSAEVQEWWIVNQTSPGKIKVRSPKNLYNAGLELYVFSDQVSPPSLGFLAGYG